MNHHTRSQTLIWFTQFSLFNGLFFTLQLALILSKHQTFLHTIPLPLSVYGILLQTLLVHIALYLLLALFQTALLVGLSPYTLRKKTLDRLLIGIWSLTLCFLLSTNHYFFPLSRLNQLLLPALPLQALKGLLLLSSLLLGLLILNCLFLLTKRYPKYTLGGGLLILVLFIHETYYPPPLFKNHSTQPHLIFIGIDSLSPRRINAKDTPTLHHLSQSSVLFTETISPLAHTYPAWTTILTGLYPFHHQARYNLMPSTRVQSSKSLAFILKNKKYQTIFATDDRQFNALGEEFGFQQIIGPKLDVNDFLLGHFNDFPLSNLLINSAAGAWLFPYNHLNRASYTTYYPESFDHALQQTLTQTNPNQPLFMAVHFTLPHWPYAFASSTPDEVNNEYSVKNRVTLYLAAIRRVDQQVSSFLQALEQHGYLNNSLVVFLSDHGEAFYEPGSRQTSLDAYQGHHPSPFSDYLKRKTSTELTMSVGHGSDLLSPDQYHCLLAFTIFKHDRPSNLPQTIDTRVALIDIKPTVLDFLGYPASHTDGISLIHSLKGPPIPLPKRTFILESGMLPNQFLTQEKAQQLAKQFFEVNSNNNQIQLREESLSALDALKLYAVIAGDWIVALYPDNAGYLPVTLNLKTGQWTDERESDFATHSPAKSMLNTLNTFYQSGSLTASSQPSPFVHF